MKERWLPSGLSPSADLPGPAFRVWLKSPLSRRHGLRRRDVQAPTALRMSATACKYRRAVALSLASTMILITGSVLLVRR